MKKIRKVFDCFNLSHEPIKLLLLRLRTHYDHVDHFCINENAITYSGVEREFMLPKYEKELEPYMVTDAVQRCWLVAFVALWRCCACCCFVFAVSFSVSIGRTMVCS